MSQGGLHSLATIIKRLEAATSRLEDLTIAQASSTSLPKRAGLPENEDPGSGLDAPPAPPAPPPAPPAPPAPAPMAEIPRSVEAFDESIVNSKLKAFVDLTKSFASPVVIEQVGYVEQVFKDLRLVLLAASTCTKPDAKAFNALLEPLHKDVMTVLQVPEKNRKERVWFNHLQIIAEGTPSVGWVEIESKPGPHVAQMKESAEFYGNKIIKEHKEKDAKQVEWVRTWLSVLEEQRKYVLEFHTTGLAWNPRGSPLSQFSGTSAPSGAPPPPPPPPATVSAPEAVGIGAIFAELNHSDEPSRRGYSARKRWYRVEMTNKALKTAALSGKKPAKFALEGAKWIIEYQENKW